MTDGSVAAQLVSLGDKVSEIRTDVAVIRSNMTKIDDHEGRIRSLEASRARIWGWWAAAAVFGAGIGYALSILVRFK
jgi:hypothetical protein